MALIILGLVLYLTGCAAWAKRLRDKNATLKTRQLHGLTSVVIAMAMPVLVGGSGFSYVLGAIFGVLGYLTIVYRPKWIVGKR
jgi:hypothetical protein